jgi:hypothetical protein
MLVLVLNCERFQLAKVKLSGSCYGHFSCILQSSERPTHTFCANIVAHNATDRTALRLSCTT